MEIWNEDGGRDYFSSKQVSRDHLIKMVRCIAVEMCTSGPEILNSIYNSPINTTRDPQKNGQVLTQNKGNKT